MLESSKISEYNNKIQGRNGLLIVFEGIDGTGKSTQLKRLAETLAAKGLDVVATREPTDGQYGRKIRQLYQQRDSVTREEELALFINDRREHVEKVITPGLQKGRVVLSDRYYFSTAAYQGAEGLDVDTIIEQNESFAPVPDLVLLIVLPVLEGLHRIQVLRQDTLNAFEQESGLARVAAVFDGFSHECIRRIDGRQSIDKVHEEVMKHVENLLAERDFKGSVKS